ncbi:MAG: hypothetical protein DCC71_10685 [Proteobacteria bacterium]|nr:MAG: hypothetical protein DCC71_10685 [Pseudomonadota bacterium]
MPFTFAHPAAVVPLQRRLGRWGVLSALVIGSMVPDLSYFLFYYLPFHVARSESHNLRGLVWFCVPAGLVCYAIFHTVLARPAVDLLPAPLRQHCGALLAGRARPPWKAIVASVFVGAATHVAWDAFTHAGAPIVRVSRALRFHLWTISGYPVSVYTILQHVSTLAGLALVFVWVRRWSRERPAAAPPAGFTLGARARSLAIVAIAVATLLLWMGSGGIAPLREPTLRGVQLFFRRAVPPGIASACVALGAYALLWQLAARAQRAPAPSASRTALP